MSYSFLFFKQKTAYEMRISDWSSDVCSSDLHGMLVDRAVGRKQERERGIGNRECQRGATCRFPQHNPRGRTRGRAALTFPIPYSLFPAPTVRDGAKCRFHRIRATAMQ